MGAFAECQPDYAAHRLPTFPVNITRSGDKRPAVRGWAKVGLRGSSHLVERFPEANAFGFCAGQRSGVTVLDVDSSDEGALADALDRYGPSPFIVRTAGKGGFQAYYRHNGEGRHIRPLGKRLPIDILGGGYVVAPPSWGVQRRYEVIQGSLDDLDRLTVMLGGAVANSAQPGPSPTTEGKRNNALFRFCMAAAHQCRDFDALLNVARTEAARYLPPVAEDEVTKTAASAWGYTERGENRFGLAGSWLPATDATRLAANPHLCALIVYLQGANKPTSEFWIADGLGEQLGWSRREFAAARRQAVGQGWVKMVRQRAPGRPAIYKWA